MKWFTYILTGLVVHTANAMPYTWDNTQIDCPIECVCQHAHFNDLSMSRWINHIQSKQQATKSDRTFKMSDIDDEELLVNGNEATYDGDESFLSNPFIKQATCILQADSDPEELVDKLPHDVQALILLYTGQERNKTVATSTLKPLNQLSTLEIRGPLDFTLRLIIDEPLNFLHHANFESIQLLGSEKSKRPDMHVHPGESFDYVPNSEKIDSNLTLNFEIEEEIAPYEIYIQELKKSRSATFYGWDHLEVLRIHHSRMDEVHYEMFQGLDNLQYLSLEYNEIEIIPDFGVYGAKHLKTLSLAHNKILDLQYRNLAGLLELEVLDLSFNSLSKLSELSFPPFPKLEYVDFRSNPIRYIFPATFDVMNNTKTMHVGSEEMELMLEANNPFDCLEFLKFLSLRNVNIFELDESVFKGLIKLETLKIKGSIRRIEFDAFVDMTNLRELDLSECGIKVISMDAFIGCKNLEIVDLSQNNLSYIPPGLFDDQPKLKEIYLNGNNLRYLPSTFFHKPSLKLARLVDNPWKCSCEMTNWNLQVTNQERTLGGERCTHDFHTGNVISCRKLEAYKFDNKLSPRCDNVKQRSVFYALRKDLRCDFEKAVKPVKQVTLPGRRDSKRKQLDDRRDRYTDKLHRKRVMSIENREFSRETWQQKQLRKYQNTLHEMNSIESRNDLTEEENTSVEDDFSFNSI